MAFKTNDGQFLEGKDFLIRLRLTNKVASASKIKKKGMLVGKQPDKPTNQTIISIVKN